MCCWKRGCLLWPVHSLGKTPLAFALLHSVFQGQICLLLQVFLDTGHHQMVNAEIRFIIFFAAKAGEALYSQQKQDQELTMAQIMNSLLPNSDLNWRKWGKPLDHSNHFWFCPNKKCFLHQNTKQLDKENLSAPEKSKFSPHHNFNIAAHIYMGRNFKPQTV